MEDFVLRIGREKIPIEVIRAKRKTLGIEVQTGGRVVAKVPTRMPIGEVEEFVLERSDWLLKHVREQKKRPQLVFPPMKELSRKELMAIKNKIYERVAYWQNIMGITIGRISIRDQKTRWGSCSSQGNLNFNYRLYYLPEELLDYVVIHELSHRRHMNHSQQFWHEVEKYCPDYKVRRKMLKEISY